MDAHAARMPGDLPIDKIEPDPAQPRKEYDPKALERLASSIRSRGVLLRISVRPGPDKWVILCGERRWRAAKLAGLEKVPCDILTRELSPSEILEDQLIEALHHEPLAPLDKAKAFAILMKRNRWNRSELAARLHVEASTVTRTLALLKTSEDVQQKIRDKKLSPRAGYEVSKLKSPETQAELADEIITQRLNAAGAGHLVRAKLRSSLGKPSGPPRTRVEYHFYDPPCAAKVIVEILKKAASPADIVEVLERTIRKVKSEIKSAAA